MTAGEPPWTVILTAAAETDFQNIIDWTLAQFGDRQARLYADILSSAIVALTDGPATIGARERREIGEGLFTLHVARNGRRGRHFILFRARLRGRKIEILRLLHDAMDLGLHAPGSGEAKP